MVIPLRDRNPTRRTAYVTWGLIAANVVVFLLSPAARGIVDHSLSFTCSELAFNRRWGAIPYELIHNVQLRLAVHGIAPPESCRLTPTTYDKYPVVSALSAQFVHAGWLHIAGNMLFLAIFGNNVEDRLGHVRYLIFYLLSGMVAAYVFALAQPDSAEALVGASGAIAGVLGAYLVLFPRARVLSLVIIVPISLPAWVVLVAWFGLQAIDALRPAAGAGGVAYLAHVVGFLFGVLVAFLIGRRGRAVRRRPPRPPWAAQSARYRG